MQIDMNYNKIKGKYVSLRNEMFEKTEALPSIHAINFNVDKFLRCNKLIVGVYSELTTMAENINNHYNHSHGRVLHLVIILAMALRK